MTLKDLQTMKNAENVKLDTMIKIREILDAAKKEYAKAGGEDDWEEVETEIKEKVFEE
jgi:hypothetical protein